MSERAAGGRALFIGKGILGLGTARPDTPDPAYCLEAFHDDPVRGVVRFSPGAVPVSSLSPGHAPDACAGAGTLVIVDELWSAFTFGAFGYDAFISLGESLARAADAAADDPASANEDGSRWKASVATALWAAMEGDLYRFAFDQPFIQELETQRDSGEWRRFARLNDLYRACIRAITPLGLAPAAWNDWLRASGRVAGEQHGFRRAFERFLTRPVDALAGVIAAKAPPDGIFMVPPLDLVES